MEDNNEMALIGLLIKKPDLLDHCQLLINFENPFYNPSLNAIFGNIQTLFNTTGKVDRRELIKMGLNSGISTDFYVSLSSNSGFDVEIHKYVQSVYDIHVKQQLSNLGHSIVNCPQDDLNDAAEYLKRCRDIIEDIEKRNNVTSGVTIVEAIQEVSEKAEALQMGKTGNYLKTGIFSIDRLIVGLETKKMSVFGARPSVGKTAFGLTIMANMTAQKISCGFLSVEMSEAECVERIAQVRSGVSIYDFGHNLHEDQQKQFYGSLNDLADCQHTQITRTTNRKIGNIRSIIRKMKNKDKGLKIVFIDYIQKLQGDDPRQDMKTQVASISGILTDIATDLDIHICVMAQLNRDGDEAPKLRHLKESGRIEEDAHYVFLIHRDLMAQHQGEYDMEAFIGIAKNRGGKTGNVQIRYNGRTTRFYDEVTEGTF